MGNLGRLAILVFISYHKYLRSVCIQRSLYKNKRNQNERGWWRGGVTLLRWENCLKRWIRKLQERQNDSQHFVSSEQFAKLKYGGLRHGVMQIVETCDFNFQAVAIQTYPRGTQHYSDPSYNDIIQTCLSPVRSNEDTPSPECWHTLSLFICTR